MGSRCSKQLRDHAKAQRVIPCALIQFLLCLFIIFLNSNLKCLFTLYSVYCATKLREVLTKNPSGNFN